MEFVTTSPLDQSFNSLPQSSDFSLPFDRTQPRTAPRSVKSAPPGDSDFSHGRRRSACFRDDKSAMPRVTDAELSNEAGHSSTTSWCRWKILTSPLLKAVFRWHDFLSRFCRFRGTSPIACQESKWMGVGPTSRPSSMFSNSESTHTHTIAAHYRVPGGKREIDSNSVRGWRIDRERAKNSYRASKPIRYLKKQKSFRLFSRFYLSVWSLGFALVFLLPYMSCRCLCGVSTLGPPCRRSSCAFRHQRPRFNSHVA